MSNDEPANSDAQLRLFKSRRGKVKSKLTRFKTYLDVTFQASMNVLELQKRLEKIESECWSEFDSIQCEIETLDPDEDQSSERDCFEESYFDLVSVAQEYIDKSNLKQKAIQLNVPASTHAISPPNIFAPQKVNLPLLNLPCFKGSYSEYTQFNETFNSLINKNTSLDDIQKFHYLISCLEGEALNLVTSLEISTQNYKVALDLLKDRYDNKRIIINSHLKSLFELPSLQKENATALRHFMDSFNKDLRSLKSLGEDIESWNTMLIYVLSSKLDFGSKREWESKIIKGQKPTLEEFIKFLNQKCQILETIYSRIDNSSGSTNQRVGFGFRQSLGDQRNIKGSSFNHVAGNKAIKCYNCKQEHCIYYCQDFLKLSNHQRLQKTKQLNLCINCLRPNSQLHTCTGSCRTCKGKHNSLLHTDYNNQVTEDSKQENKNEQNERSSAEAKGHAQLVTQSPQDNLQGNDYNNVNINAHVNQGHNSLVLLATAMVLIENKQGKFVQCRALLDGGSQSNFITSDLSKKLDLEMQRIQFPITGIGEKVTNISRKVHTKVKSRVTNFSCNLSFLVLDQITGHIPSQSFDSSQIDIPNGIQLADEQFSFSKQVDILLGASVFYELLSLGQIKLKKNQCILQNTKLGWLVTGSLYIDNLSERSDCFLSVEDNRIHSQLERFWTLEDVSCSSNKSVKFTKDEQYCEEHFLQNHKRDETGRFSVALPLKENYKDIGDTLVPAEKRFLHLEQKMQRNETFGKMYRDFMTEYETLNHMTKLDKAQVDTDEPLCYLPHHGVFKASSETTKLRVVFDASAKGSNNMSLNDVSYVGPTIQEELYSVILRFRIHNFVLKGDITKMYRQININTDQRNLQRIVWRDNPDLDLSHYTLNTVTYGTAPAAFLAIRSLQQVAIENENTYSKACQTILTDFYVDDLITGDSSIEDLKLQKKNISAILQSAGFMLTQFKSNCKDVLDSNEHQNNVELSNDETVKALGVLWNPNLDTFQFSVNIKLDTKHLTKRVILSIISQIFDPLGILGAVIIKAKIILQQLWKLKVNWDEPIPASHHAQFLQFFLSLKSLDLISIPRHVFLSTYINTQIHGFTDASEAAYGVCIYIRSMDFTGKVMTRLLCSKSRVAPLKVISLPRLELCGALLLSRLLDKTLKSLKMKFNDIHLWTDSQIVLAWISQEPSHWKTFIGNRVSEIQSLTNSAHWKHVSSNDNPADLISRGCNPQQLIDSELWWSGPHWLPQAECHWASQSNYDRDKLTNIPEVRNNNKTVCLATEINFDILTRFSDLNKLLRVTALCLRFIKNLKVKAEFRAFEKLKTHEINEAMITLVKSVQAVSFSKEIIDLKKQKQVSQKSNILSLNPYLDETGLIRVGGRLANAEIDKYKKSQILLPSKHFFTELLIRNEHKITLHGGVQTVLSAVRNKFWPINAKYMIKKVIRECVLCYRAKPKYLSPLMGQLPGPRVTPSRPFYVSGCDFAGPFIIKEGTLRSKKLVKVYICIFVCFSTKAIHLELCGDLSTPMFLNALKRFFSRRGISKEIWSDNGSNFVGAANEIERVHESLTKINNDDSFQIYLNNNRVSWHFIPPRAPHFGGLWESAVKSMKHHLIRVVGDSHLDYEHFNTVIIQIESILNSRPISPLSQDPNDLDPLTPGHFLIGEKLNSLPEENVEDIPLNRLNKFQIVQRMTKDFWHRWSQEYLHTLQQRNKWRLRDPMQLKPGLMVVLREDNISPLRWKLGRIVEVHPGKDNIARVATIKTSNGTVKRAFSKVCVLPIEIDSE